MLAATMQSDRQKLQQCRMHKRSFNNRPHSSQILRLSNLWSWKRLQESRAGCVAEPSFFGTNPGAESQGDKPLYCLHVPAHEWLDMIESVKAQSGRTSSCCQETQDPLKGWSQTKGTTERPSETCDFFLSSQELYRALAKPEPSAGTKLELKWNPSFQTRTPIVFFLAQWTLTVEEKSRNLHTWLKLMGFRIRLREVSSQSIRYFRLLKNCTVRKVWKSKGSWKSFPQNNQKIGENWKSKSPLCRKSTPLAFQPQR